MSIYLNHAAGLEDKAAIIGPGSGANSDLDMSEYTPKRPAVNEAGFWNAARKASPGRKSRGQANRLTV